MHVRAKKSAACLCFKMFAPSRPSLRIENSQRIFAFLRGFLSLRYSKKISKFNAKASSPCLSSVNRGQQKSWVQELLRFLVGTPLAQLNPSRLVLSQKLTEEKRFAAVVSFKPEPSAVPGGVARACMQGPSAARVTSKQR